MDLVLRHYTFPSRIKWFPQQIQVVNERATGRQGGLWLDMGTGKTLCSTAVALYKKLTSGSVTVVIMPPILIRQWGVWLRSISPALSVVEFRGTPKQRAAMSLDADFVLVGAQIFKKEKARFKSHFANRPTFVIVDEATMVASIRSDIHDMTYDFCVTKEVELLSGTPANKPGDAYGLMKFTAPGLYRNRKHFDNLHVATWDFWGNPSEWQNLDLLKQNLMTNSSRVLLQDLYPDLDKPLYVPLPYDLDDAHYKLYTKLSEEALLKLPEGGKIDATTAQRLRHALGQIVINYGHFSGEPKNISMTIDLVRQKLDELGDGKLVVFADYRMTVAHLCSVFEKQGFLPINSTVSDVQKHRNLQRFINDPDCRGLVVQFVSGGKGLDGLQHVCSHCLFVEPCLQPRDFHQAVARLHRLGQSKKVIVYMATAMGTLQVRGFRNLLDNDTLANQVVRNAVDLRAEIFGK